MSFDTCSGPLRSGTVFWTTGTVPGTVQNTGLATLNQVVEVLPADWYPTGGSIFLGMLPQYSQITNIFIDVVQAFIFTGGTTGVDLSIGSTTLTTEFVPVINNVSAVGREVVQPQVQYWIDVDRVPGATTDVPAYLNYTFAGGVPTAILAGAVAVTIQYIQKGPDGTMNPKQS